MRTLLYILMICSLVACSSEDEQASEKNYIVKPDGTKVFKSEGIELTLLKKGERGNVKNFEGVSFVFKDVSALNYLLKSGDVPRSEDMKELEKESVFMLELVGHEASGSIFQNAEMTLSQNEATQYLIGEIEKDFVIVQKGKRIKPQGVQYDGVIGTGQKIRVAFFIKGVNLNAPYTIEYYDRLFGKGLVKLTRKTTNIIS